MLHVFSCTYSSFLYSKGQLRKLKLSGRNKNLYCTHIAEGHTNCVLSVCATNSLLFSASQGWLLWNWIFVCLCTNYCGLGTVLTQNCSIIIIFIQILLFPSNYTTIRLTRKLNKLIMEMVLERIDFHNFI